MKRINKTFQNVYQMYAEFGTAYDDTERPEWYHGIFEEPVNKGGRYNIHMLLSDCLIHGRIEIARHAIARRDEAAGAGLQSLNLWTSVIRLGLALCEGLLDDGLPDTSLTPRAWLGRSQVCKALYRPEWLEDTISYTRKRAGWRDVVTDDADTGDTATRTTLRQLAWLRMNRKYIEDLAGEFRRALG